MFNIIKYKNIFLSVAGGLVAVCLVSIAVLGFKQGIDFTGGTLWQFRISSQTPTLPEVVKAFQDTLAVPDVQLTIDANANSFLARLPETNETKHREYLQKLTATYPALEELSFQSIGPSVSRALKKNALLAVLFVLVGISLYIAFAFRKVSRPVSSWKYGWITLVTLLHDVVIPAGMLAILGYYGKVEIDTNFIVALLVVMGFSVHDTIVVFDRIRENLILERGKTQFGSIINNSINQTLARSINTSLTLVLVLLALYFTGPATLRYFILTLLVGVVAGTYSSIFVASPALLVVSGKTTRTA